MSTKSTLAHGENFHFYHDLMDEDDVVHLRIDEPCGHSRSMMIPIDIWEVIRHTGGARLDLVLMTDEALRERAKTEVEERIAEYKAAKTKEAKVWIGFAGSLVLGDIKTSKKRQVEHAFKYYKAEREKQDAVKAAIAKHKVIVR